jgi:hypothetical protein
MLGNKVIMRVEPKFNLIAILRLTRTLWPSTTMMHRPGQPLITPLLLQILLNHCGLSNLNPTKKHPWFFQIIAYELLLVLSVQDVGLLVGETFVVVDGTF